MIFINCQTETLSGLQVVFVECSACGGSGEMWIGSGTSAMAVGASQTCFSCRGSGRVIDLDATMQGICESGIEKEG